MGGALLPPCGKREECVMLSPVPLLLVWHCPVDGIISLMTLMGNIFRLYILVFEVKINLPKLGKAATVVALILMDDSLSVILVSLLCGVLWT